MSNEAIHSWVGKAKSAPKPAGEAGGIRVIHREVQSRGNLIMEIAEKIRPWLLKMFEGVHDENGMLMQQAHVRGIALNMAQNIVKEQENK